MFFVADRTLTTLQYQWLSGFTTEINPSTVIPSLEKGSIPSWQISRVTTDRQNNVNPLPADPTCFTQLQTLIHTGFHSSFTGFKLTRRGGLFQQMKGQ
jgi:hypothetical protein